MGSWGEWTQGGSTVPALTPMDAEVHLFLRLLLSPLPPLFAVPVLVKALAGVSVGATVGVGVVVPTVVVPDLRTWCRVSLGTPTRGGVGVGRLCASRVLSPPGVWDGVRNPTVGPEVS